MTETHLEIETHSDHKKALLLVLLLAVTFAVFWQSTGHEFIVYDDDVIRKRESPCQHGTGLSEHPLGFHNHRSFELASPDIVVTYVRLSMKALPFLEGPLKLILNLLMRITIWVLPLLKAGGSMKAFAILARPFRSTPL